MRSNNRNFIDDMVDVFGYDYVIGYCLCSEYDMNNMADKEKDQYVANKYRRRAKMFGSKVEQLTRERIKNGL